MPALGNWVKMTWSSGTTGALTLTKAATYPSFNELLVGLGFAAATNSNVDVQVHYTLADETNGNYETGVGTFNPSTNILTRTAIAQTATTSGGVTTVTTIAATAITASATVSVFLGTTTNSSPFVFAGTGQTGTTHSGATWGHVSSLNWAISGTANPTINTEYWNPFLWPSNSSLNAITFRLGSGTTGNIQLGIYEMKNDGSPGKLLWDSGSYAPTASSANSRSITAGTPTAVTLAPGWYWFVMNCSAATLTYYRLIACMLSAPSGPNSYGLQIGSFTRSRTQGTLTDPGPALSAMTVLDTISTPGSTISGLYWRAKVNA